MIRHPDPNVPYRPPYVPLLPDAYQRQRIVARTRSEILPLEFDLTTQCQMLLNSFSSSCYSRSTDSNMCSQSDFHEFLFPSEAYRLFCVYPGALFPPLAFRLSYLQVPSQRDDSDCFFLTPCSCTNRS